MPHFVTLGMFIIDEFSIITATGTSRTLAPQIGGGGTYAAIGARIWLPPSQIGMIIDRGSDFPPSFESKLAEFGSEMWTYRNQPGGTTRALNTYQGDQRSFDYITPRIRITPQDLQGTRLENAKTLHFICSPSRASVIMSQAREILDWNPIVIYEPIPDRCVPEELGPLVKVLPQIDILRCANFRFYQIIFAQISRSPNAEEALSLLSLPLPPTLELIEEAARRFLEFGVGVDRQGCVIIRSGAMGACVAMKNQPVRWVPAFWTRKDQAKIVDVTGAGNSFLGGLAAGLLLEGGDIYKATFHASVSASFVIEQEGLPTMSNVNESTQWNGDTPQRRLVDLKKRQVEPED
ncbi:Ribokinase-like protein [Mycena metata]|uniref:Ribokinase-like protein n=1 Tax=Mycena metata TaxID=1033252 RepID=A0AAD7KA22_9AGAR|nr:Ribokinase-like protein [Mycena metata]